MIGKEKRQVVRSKKHGKLFPEIVLSTNVTPLPFGATESITRYGAQRSGTALEEEWRPSNKVWLCLPGANGRRIDHRPPRNFGSAVRILSNVSRLTHPLGIDERTIIKKNKGVKLPPLDNLSSNDLSFFSGRFSFESFFSFFFFIGIKLNKFDLSYLFSLILFFHFLVYSFFFILFAFAGILICLKS